MAAVGVPSHPENKLVKSIGFSIKYSMKLFSGDIVELRYRFSVPIGLGSSPDFATTWVQNTDCGKLAPGDIAIVIATAYNDQRTTMILTTHGVGWLPTSLLTKVV